jgi:hypothetical protein
MQIHSRTAKQTQMGFLRKDNAAELPPQWNELAGNYFRSTPFLLYCEMHNPCLQRYYLCYQNETFMAGAVVYSLALNIFTFARLRYPIQMTIVGIPASVSATGIFGKSDYAELLKDHICAVEKGFILFLNLEEKPLKGKHASGKTLPSIIIENTFTNWHDYLNGLRAPYRRRLLHIRQKEKNLELKKMKCDAFNLEMYQLYMQVYNRSKDKLEKLSQDFFKKLPTAYSLTACYFKEKLLGWNISLHIGDTFYFFMGGVDYEMNRTYNTYFLLLTDLVKDGIEKKANFIELGQTAEIPKMRLGGQVSERYMEAHHSNRIFNGLLKIFSPLLEYNRKLEMGKVFKVNNISLEINSKNTNV